MNNTKTTKRALLSSVMAMLICVAMLIGTTFAWFTDKASTAVNKIQAGTLKVQLLDAADNDLNGTTLTWQKAAGHESEAVLWEPGCTYDLKSFKIKNNGNLALKYKIIISGIVGDNELLNAIDFTVSGVTGAETATALNGFEGHLTANSETALITITGKMKKEAGNEYQGKKITGIGITVVATQDTVEVDSFGDQYDATAKYPVSNDTDLADAIINATAGSSVTLTSGSFTIPATNVAEGVTITGYGADKTKIVPPATTSGTKKTGFVISNENVTISNLTINRNWAITQDEYCGFVDIQNGGATLDGVVINNSSGSSSVVIKNGVDYGETVMLKNSTFKGGFKTINIVDGANGTVVIDNCEITGVYTFNVNSSSSQDLTIKVSDSKLHGWTSYGRIKEAVFVNTEFSKGTSSYDYLRPYADTTLTDCTFDSSFLMGSGTTGNLSRISD